MIRSLAVSRPTTRARASGQRRRSVFVLTSLLMMVVIVGAGAVTAALLHDRRLADRDFEVALGADRAAQELSDSLARTVARLEGAGALVGPEGVVDDRQYAAFADSLSLHPPVVASALMLTVDDEDREEFEATTGIVIVDRSPGEDRRVADHRPTYTPIVAVSPDIDGAEQLLGFDYLGDEVRGAAVRRAWSTGEAAVSGRTTRVLTGEHGFVVIQPLHHLDRPGAAPDDLAPIGFVAVSYDSSDLRDLIEARTDATVAQIDVGGEPLLERALPEPSAITERTVEVAGATWTVYVAAPAGVSLWPPVLVLSVSVLVALLVGEIIRRTWRYERSLAWWSRSMEEAQQRTENLRRLTDSLRRSENLDDLAATALAHGAGLLEATWCRLQLETDDGTIITAAEAGTSTGASLQRLPLRTSASNHGVMLVEPGVVDLPLAGRTMRATVAGLIADAISRTKQRQADHELAESLQRMLLPQLPDDVGFGSISATYRPLQDSAVGGDWFDVLHADERFALVVGDVVGKGPRAAGAMGNLRIACRMFDELEHPHRLLEHLDGVASDVEDAFMATAVVIVLDPVAGEIRVSRAGHPPPFVLTHGTHRWLDGALGPPLGLAEGPRTSSVLPWTGPIRVVAYTDGLIEVRGQSLDIGLQSLAEAAVRLAAHPLQPFVEALVDAQLDDIGSSDDVALLAADLRDPTEIARVGDREG